MPYLPQISKWENSYRPDFQGMDILEWAQRENNDDNHMMNKLSGNTQRKMANEEQLQLAMNTVKQYFIVGLTKEMDESFRRFNRVLGINEPELFGCGLGRSNSNSHPKVSSVIVPSFGLVDVS